MKRYEVKNLVASEINAVVAAATFPVIGGVRVAELYNYNGRNVLVHQGTEVKRAELVETVLVDFGKRVR